MDNNVTPHLDLVKSQAKRLEKLIVKYPDDPRTGTAYKILISQFNAAEKWMADTALNNDRLLGELAIKDSVIGDLKVELAKRESSLNNLDITPHDLVGLPAEVIAQLSIGESDLQELKLLEILDKLIIEFYKQTGEIQDRAKLNAKLYRMSSKGMLFSVPGKRGAYSIYKQDQDELFKEEVE